jgi:DNA-binding CsgD family transcriptional regulator
MDELKHYGTPRHSGRYPWGSGEHPEERNGSWIGNVRKLHNQGLSDNQIAKGLGMNTSEFRKRKTLELVTERKANQNMAMRLKEKGMSNVAIGERMGINESSVRALLNPSMQEKTKVISNVADALRSRTDEVQYLDIGEGVEQHIGINRTKMNAAIKMLQDEGYQVQYVKTLQQGTGKYTSIKVLTPPNTSYSELYANRDQIKLVNSYTEDGGRTIIGLETPKSLDGSRVAINYGDQGGSEKDGLIELRRGVDDVSLGNAQYAQVRIEVDGTHYMKGMAMYSDDMPEGKDIIYNTNKPSGSTNDEVFKSLKADPENPFGAIVRQRHYIDANGNDQLSTINIVNEQGDWEKYAKNISSQVLSKQSPALAKQQLGLAFDIKSGEFDELNKLTNPAVKKRLLDSFADDCDAEAVHLKAAPLPGQGWHVLLPILSVKEKEIYAPNYNNEDQVVLIRHPHGGTFEIPELTVNNKNPEAIRLIGDAPDAVGINPKVAAKLSGADFDGDTVIVIPNKNGNIKTSSSIKSLQEFDPQSEYKLPDDAPKIKSKTKQVEMGKISNLITDMTVKGANENEIVRAVKHSMVVIDSEKHHLDYKLSAIENNIAELKKLYQDKVVGGASTLISKAASEIRVLERKDRGTVTTPVKINPKTGETYGNTDPVTGKKIYKETGGTYEIPIYKTDSTTGEKVPTGETRTVARTTKSSRMAETDNALELSSGTKMETVYGNHANALKDLANRARLASLAIVDKEYSAIANKTYAKEVASLEANLNLAFRNKPLERQAQLLANKNITAKRQSDPNMDPADLKKIRGQELTKARLRVGAGKQEISISDREWEAIQAGAISKNRLSQILLNTDVKALKERAMPRTSRGMLPARVTRAKSMLARGYTRKEVSDSLGVSLNTLNKALG